MDLMAASRWTGKTALGTCHRRRRPENGGGEVRGMVVLRYMLACRQSIRELNDPPWNW
ncbi:hypothetical protein HPP92_004220 [Vanilla planifolia]|uniref:Uncharacterized protein n=1 Tax=Vanilla planifolia TaxID=51239 RepID=A0A835S1D5_VANPL|nr:hypothetical protein HPP92_004220 [Vanilla planifolia]